MNIGNIQDNWLVYLITLIVALFGLSKGQRNNVIDRFGNFLDLIRELGNFIKNGAFDVLIPKAKTDLLPLNEVPNVFNKVFNWINNFLSEARDQLNSHGLGVVNAIVKDEDMREWRIFGYIFQLAFLFLFAYSDAIQLVNTYLILFPQDAGTVPDFLKDLTPALMMSSVGVAVASSFIIADFHGVTHFGKWNTLQGGFRKVTYTLVWISLLFSLFVDALTSIYKITSISHIVSVLPASFMSALEIAAPIAAMLVIIPMLIITFMFLEGLVGLAVLYSLFIWLLALLVGLLNLILIILTAFVIFTFSYLFQFTYRGLMWIIVVLTLSLGYALIGSGITLVEVTKLLQVILNLVYFPLDSIINLLVRLFNRPHNAA